jgi:Undecaprenyl-phosphate galactose phosphotransferase WbaP
LFIIAGRILAKFFLLKVGAWKRPTVIVGIGNNAKLAYEALSEEKLLAYPVVAFACLSEAERPASGTLDVFGNQFPVVTLGDQPDAMLRQLGCRNVVVATDVLDVHANLIHALSMSGRNVIVIPSISGLPLHGVEVSHFFSHETLMLSVRNNLGRKGAQIIKRIFDIVMSLFLLAVLSPLFMFVASRIRRESGPPAIFSQERVGRRGEVFRFLKFRSMVCDAEDMLMRWRNERPDLWEEYQRNNFKLKNDPRMLKVGHWIRQTSIDELPQLLNVLRGEMSLVGPRPLLARELGAYGATIDLYRQVRPGITGLWQISGRSQTKFVDRAAYDAWYVRNWSLWYDFVILLRTVKVVFTREGAY